MTNSLTLKQCHFVGQSSILFSKYIYESFQGLYNQTGYVFLSLIRGSYSDGEPDDGAPPRDADSGSAASHRLAAQARSSNYLSLQAELFPVRRHRNTHEACVMSCMLSFCHQALCLSAAS